MERTTDAMREDPVLNASEDSALTLGIELRDARNANSESIEDVARLLRINWRYIEALEEGRYSDLPGTAYAIGFIRTYSDYLGLDSADMVVRFKEASDGVAKKTKLDFPEPIPDSGLPGGAILFAGIVVAILTYGGWYMSTEEDSFLARLVSPVPDHLAESIDSNAPSEVSANTSDSMEPEMEPAQEPEVIEDDVAASVTEPESTTPEPEQSIVQDEPVSEPVEIEAVAVEPTTVEPTVVEPVVEEIAQEVAEVVEAIEPVVSAEPVDVQIEAPEAAISETPSIEADVAEAIEPAPMASAESEPEPDMEALAEATAEDKAETLALNEAQLSAIQDTSEEPVTAIVESSPESVAVTAVPEPEPALEPEPVSEQPVAGDEAPAEVVDNDAQVAAVPSDAGDVASDSSGDGRVYGEQGDVRVVVKAKTNSWIQVRDDVSSQLLLTRLLRAGDIYRVPNRSGLTLLTGNAGALEILVDGNVVPSIGDSGDVRRNVALDAERLLAGDAASE